VRGLHLRRGRAREDAQYVAGGDDEDVEEGDPLEAERVERRRDAVDDRRGQRGGRGEEDGAERDDCEDGGGGERRRGRERARGDGPALLDGMPPIGLRVADVVQEVERGRKSAERGRDDDRAPREVGTVRDLPEEDGREDEEVLDPLRGPEGPEEGEAGLSGNTGTPRSPRLPSSLRAPTSR
jgi:hypothetical protein